ncbi:MAG: hypothetical protein KF715_13370 [Candidatus Didemnitutus sp.]|nr:hypothetical protein [Candidatus Didemnitutus sp.]
MSELTNGASRMPPLKVWWIIWGAILVSLGAIWWSVGFLKLPAAAAHKNPFYDLVSLVPLFVSIVVRWLVLPRYTDGARAFVVFVAGIALAEVAGILGIFLGGPYRDDLFLLGALGIAQFVPLYTKRLQEPKPEGFIPNN